MFNFTKNGADKVEETSEGNSKPNVINNNAEPSPKEDSSEMNKPTYIEIDASKVRCWKYHNRNSSWLSRPEQETLKNSIDRDGQLEAGLVRRVKDDSGVLYEIIYGFRRSEACKSLNIKFKARVLPFDTPDSVCMQYMHVENKESKDVSELEDAVIYARLLKDGVYKSQYELADSLCITQGYVSRLVSTTKVFEHPWLKELIEPIIMNVSVIAANKLSTGLKDPQVLRTMQYAAGKIENPKELKTGADIVNALIDTEKRLNKGMKKNVLVKRGRNNVVELKNNSQGRVVLTIEPYERTEDESKELLSAISNELNKIILK